MNKHLVSNLFFFKKAKYIRIQQAGSRLPPSLFFCIADKQEVCG